MKGTEIMKKICIPVVMVLLCVGVLFLSAGAADSSADNESNVLESALEESPELSSILDEAESGLSTDALLDALGQIEGLDLDTLLQGLEGLDEDDGLLGKLSSILGPDSNGLSGILSGLGDLVGTGGSGSGAALESILNQIGGGSGSATTEEPTVHTTAGSYNQNVTIPSQYTPNYNYSGGSSSGNIINYNQYTGTYTLPAQITVGEVTTQSYTVPETTMSNISVALPAGEESADTEQSTNWKKVVGAILVFGSFAGIAAVVIKKSM